MAGKRVLVLSYWGLHDVLTQAAVLPHLQLLLQVQEVTAVILVTIEREENRDNFPTTLQKFPQIRHYALQSKNYRNVFINKSGDFLLFPRQLQQIVKAEEVNALLASGAMAGALVQQVCKKLRLPFYVLFEPHAAYMLDSREWHRYDLRFLVQQKWEKEQTVNAAGLIVVSAQYRQCFLSEYPELNPDQVFVGRNPVDVAVFQFYPASRSKTRYLLEIPPSAVVGIYVGKYGGLYYNEEAFAIYKQCFDTIPDFRLIILSPQPQEEIRQQLQLHGIEQAKVYIACVPHSEVPQYLSAADFAFATIKSYPSARYCSPVKVGEYWASGLPVLLTEGVGDDSDIIREEGGGATFDLQQEGSVARALEKILNILQDPNHRYEIPKLAEKYRSPERLREAYEYFFGQSIGGV